mgnify:CR=1 FL=1
MNRQEIKAKAKEFAFKNKWNIFKPFLIFFGIYFVVGFILGFCGFDSESTVSIVITSILDIALLPASIGYIYYIIKLINGEALEVMDAFKSKYKFFGLILLSCIMVSIFGILWSLLLIVPGIIYMFKMAMVNYVLAEVEDNNIKYKEVLNTSEELMDGYKWDYFVFNLSFFGWILLIVLTCGIATIWAYPYMTTAQVMYYQELKKIKNK